MVESEKNGVMSCIICMIMKPCRTSGGEHVIPYALGGSFTISRVCLDCDNRLGNTADAGLINLTAIEVRRAALGLAGHDGIVPDPEKRALRKPLISERDSKHRLRQQVDSNSGELVTKTESYVEFDVQDVDGGVLIQPAHVYIDADDADKAEMLARSGLKKKGIKDEELLNRMSREFAEGLQVVAGIELFSRSVQERTTGHQLGLLKIAYELAWHWLGDAWLKDPNAQAMCDLLCGREPSSPVRGKIFDDPDKAIIPVGDDPRVMHVAYLYAFERGLIVMLRLFDVFAVGFVAADGRSGYSVPERNGILMQNVERWYKEAAFGEMEGSSVAWQHDESGSHGT